MARYLVATSDWHCDARTAGASRRQEIGRSIMRGPVAKAIELATEGHQVVHVFAGDLGDPHRASSCHATAQAVEVATRLQSARVRSVWIVGNHDVVEDGTGDHMLMALEHVPMALVAADPVCVVLEGIPIACLPYPSLARMYDPARWVEQAPLLSCDAAGNLDAFSVAASEVFVIGHLSIPGITPGSETQEMPRGRDVQWPVQAIKRRWPKAVLLGGHYHRSQEFGGVRIIGSIGRLTWGEQDHEPGYLVCRYGGAS